MADLSKWLTSSLPNLDELQVSARFEQVGIVEHCGDGIASISGLAGVPLGGLVRIGEQGLGLALSLDHETVHCVVLSDEAAIEAGMKAVDLGRLAQVPVGPSLLGRVVDPLGFPLDGGDPIQSNDSAPVERPAPGIIERDFVNQTLSTGLTVVDAMIPLGRGQRQLVIGDRKTGKTAIAVDTILNQRETDVISIYAGIGQKDSSIVRIIDTVHRLGAPERCIFVIGEADSPPGRQWLTPYAACAMAEYFRDRGQHVLLVLDDLTKHAAIYRELSLLLRRPPGREAYPGDIFYIHSRLLERASKLSQEKGGGSLTALPIAETQAGNLSAYIPTNLVSITDGQIYLEPKLFYEGQKPAVNVGLSVSRVGAKAQPPALKALASHMRLAYAQFLELEVFLRFGSIVDARTRATIEHGRRIRAVLSQPQSAPLSLAEQAALLIAVGEGLLDAIPLELVPKLREALRISLQKQMPGVAERINKTGALSDEDRAALVAHLKDSLKTLGAQAGQKGESDGTAHAPQG